MKIPCPGSFARPPRKENLPARGAKAARAGSNVHPGKALRPPRRPVETALHKRGSEPNRLTFKKEQ